MKIIQYPIYDKQGRPNSQDPHSIFRYITDLTQDLRNADIRYEPGGTEEQIISEVPDYGVLYAMYFIKGPFPLAEPKIAKVPNLSVVYATTVIKERFYKGEKAILRDPRSTQQYEENLERLGIKLDQQYYQTKANKQMVVKLINVEIGNLLYLNKINIDELIDAIGP